MNRSFLSDIYSPYLSLYDLDFSEFLTKDLLRFV